MVYTHIEACVVPQNSVCSASVCVAGAGARAGGSLSMDFGMDALPKVPNPPHSHMWAARKGDPIIELRKSFWVMKMSG